MVSVEYTLCLSSWGLLSLLTEVFSKVKKNGVLQTYPTVIHFDGYRVGEAHQQTLVR